MIQSYERVRDEVQSRIRARIWPPGALIPTEEALAEEFGCARATVNRALRELAEAGLLQRKRKAGTRVAELPVRKARLDIPVIRHEIEARGLAYGYRLLSSVLELPPPAVASRLGLAEGMRLLHLQSLHLAGPTPHAHEDRWLNPAVLPNPAPDFARLSANEWLVANLAFVTGDIAFTAAPASAGEAQALAVAPGAALFITERCTWGANAPITFVRLAHAPGYRLQTQL